MIILNFQHSSIRFCKENRKMQKLLVFGRDILYNLSKQSKINAVSQVEDKSSIDELIAQNRIKTRKEKKEFRFSNAKNAYLSLVKKKKTMNCNRSNG